MPDDTVKLSWQRFAALMTMSLLNFQTIVLRVIAFNAWRMYVCVCPHILKKRREMQQKKKNLHRYL